MGTLDKKILVTGANGLVGQCLVRELAGTCELLATARQPALREGLPPVPYRPLDISIWQNCRDVILQFKPDVIINAAAFTHVDACETQREVCWRANVKGVEYLARVARRIMALLIQISTDYIFDGQNGPYPEDHPPAPIGYYGKAKLAAENAVRMTGIPYAIIRTNVVYGTGADVKNNFFLWVYNSLKAGKPIRVVTDQFNNPTLADDLAAGIHQLIEQSKYGIYHLAGPEYCSRYDFARKIAAVFEFSPDHIHPITSADLPQTAPRPLHGGLRIEKAVHELGYQPRATTTALQLLKERLRTHL